MRTPIYLLAALAITAVAADPQPRITLSRDGKTFILQNTTTKFLPLGHNYGNAHRLMEDFWETDFKTIEDDFAELKALGTNVIRVHLQFGKFIPEPQKPDAAQFGRLARMLKLAEKHGTYLDITGLACYRTADVPKWYDTLSEKERWAAQAFFWSEVARACSESPAVFCYDLINEPLAPPGEKRKDGDWYSGKPFGGLDFLQFISLDPAGRARDEIVRDWIRMLTAAIRQHDKQTLITVGMLPPIPKWGYFSGFVPAKVAPELDFISVHLYPESGKIPEAVEMLKGYAVGKPVVIEEVFQLKCSTDELRDFLNQSRQYATGWIGHYDGDPPEAYAQLEKEKKIDPGQKMYWAWLELFKEFSGTVSIEK